MKEVKEVQVVKEVAVEVEVKVEGERRGAGSERSVARTALDPVGDGLLAGVLDNICKVTTHLQENRI